MLFMIIRAFFLMAEPLLVLDSTISHLLFMFLFLLLSLLPSLGLERVIPAALGPL